LISGNPNVTFLLDLQLYDGATNKFVRAFLRDGLGNIFQQQDLVHVGSGLYTKSTTIGYVGSYTVQYIVYTNSLYTLEDFRYVISEEQIEISHLLTSAEIVTGVLSTDLTPYTVPYSLGLYTKIVANEVENNFQALYTLPSNLDNIFAKIVEESNLILAAIAPKATQSSVDNIESQVISLQAGQITANDVWSFTTRTITAPVVASNIDMSILAKTTEVNAAADRVISELENSMVNITTGVITATKTQEIMAWLEIDGQVIMDPIQCQIIIKDGLGATIHDFGVNTTPLPNGFFRYLKTSADLLLGKGQTYVAAVSILHGAKTYTALRGLTVLS
jgi:hypothetical protein